jgi:hypothetical protein
MFLIQSTTNLSSTSHHWRIFIFSELNLTGLLIYSDRKENLREWNILFRTLVTISHVFNTAHFQEWLQLDSFDVFEASRSLIQYQHTGFNKLFKHGYFAFRSACYSMVTLYLSNYHWLGKNVFKKISIT